MDIKANRQWGDSEGFFAIKVLSPNHTVFSDHFVFVLVAHLCSSLIMFHLSRGSTRDSLTSPGSSCWTRELDCLTPLTNEWSMCPRLLLCLTQYFIRPALTGLGFMTEKISISSGGSLLTIFPIFLTQLGYIACPANRCQTFKNVAPPFSSFQNHQNLQPGRSLKPQPTSSCSLSPSVVTCVALKTMSSQLEL